MDHREEWRKVERQIKFLRANPNHIFKETVIDEWLNKTAYNCKCIYFNLPSNKEADDVTINQDKWDNILLKDFDFSKWVYICDDEFFPDSINYFNQQRPLEAIHELKPIIDEIIDAFKILYDVDDRQFIDILYDYLNSGFKTTSKYFSLTGEQKSAYLILHCNRAALKQYIDNN